MIVTKLIRNKIIMHIVDAMVSGNTDYWSIEADIKAQYVEYSAELYFRCWRLAQPIYRGRLKKRYK